MNPVPKLEGALLFAHLGITARNEGKDSSMNAKPNARKWSWIQLKERRAARKAIFLLLLLLSMLPAAVQAQSSYTINNGTIIITQFAINQYFSLLPVQVGGLPTEDTTTIAYE
jgi:hypothetical protein